MRSTCVLLGAALVVSLTGCDATHTTPATETARPGLVWVVQSVGYSRHPNRWTVFCVPQGEENLARSEVAVVREVGVAEATADAVDTGDTCPAGPVLGEF